VLARWSRAGLVARRNDVGLPVRAMGPGRRAAPGSLATRVSSHARLFALEGAGPSASTPKTRSWSFADIRANPPGPTLASWSSTRPNQRPDNIVKLVQAFLSEHFLESFQECTVIVEAGRVRVRRPPER
jgi:hypothetical protein